MRSNHFITHLKALAQITLFAVSLETASAQFFNNTTGISNPAETITFSEHSVVSQTALTTQFQDLGATFSNMYYTPQPQFSWPNITPPDAGNFLPNVQSHPFTISFTQAQTSAGFAMATGVGTSTFTALLNGVTVATGAAPSGFTSSLNYYGFSGVLFNQINVSVSSPDLGSATIDNLQLGAAPNPSGQLTITPAGSGLGLSLSTFATGFPVANTGSSTGNAGPLGIAFPSSGRVLVSDAPGNVRLFATDTNNQTAASAPIGQSYGTFRAVGLASLGGNIYLGEHNLPNVVQLNPNGSFNQNIVTGVNARGLVANPFSGHLFVSTVTQNTIFEVDPIAKTATPFITAIDADGLTLSADGLTLYAAVLGQRILGFNIATKTQVFDSGLIPGVDGTVLGAGLLTGEIFANTNYGELIEVDLANPSHKTVIASGGTRGDFVTVDPNNGTLLITQVDSIMRLNGGTFQLAVPEPATIAGSILVAIACGAHFIRRRERAGPRV